MIDGVRVSPEANISTGVEFKPLEASHPIASVRPDFSMAGPEVVPWVKIMRAQGWFVSYLYNQETDERPQLFFSHMLKTGDACALAGEMRRGLEQN